MRKYGVHFGYWGRDYGTLGLPACLKQAKAAGAQTFELRVTDEIAAGDREKILEIKKQFQEADLEPVFTFRYPKGCDMLSPERSARDKAVEYMKRCLEGIGILGGKNLGGILYATWPAKYDEDLIGLQEKYERTQRSIESVRRVIKTAEDNDVNFNVEAVNRFEHYIINTAAEGAAFCRQVESPKCRLLLDCFHMNIEEEDLPGAIRSAKGYLAHFHVSEPSRKVPYHQAGIDWHRVGAALREIGYDGSVTIEAFVVSLGANTYPMRLWRNLEEDVSLENRLRLLSEGLIYIKKQFEEG